MSLRCHLGYHDRTWKREEYRVRLSYLVSWQWQPEYSTRYRLVGTCRRCGKVKHKNL